MQKIVPNIWFNANAKEAVDFYTSIFNEGRVINTMYYPEDNLPDFQKDMAGKEVAIDFELEGYRFGAINAGPEFAVNPSISFMLNFDPSQTENAVEYLDALWDKLSEGGKVLMPLDEYPFSKHYGWVQDRYDVTWQLILTDPAGDPRPFIIPSLMFGGEHQNQAEEAIKYYLEVFKDSREGQIARYPEPTGTATQDSVMFADFTLLGQWFAAMDSGEKQDFTFNEGVSLLVNCKDQAEIDYYWEKLSSNPQNEQCGWCKDKFGVSWQIAPENMEELMQKPDAYNKMIAMKKLVISDF